MKKFLCVVSFALISWQAIAQHQDHILWYKEPAKQWVDALPVGNGRLGAMVYGDLSKETIQLNEESLWGGAKVDANANAAAYIPEIQRLLIAGEIEKATVLSEKHLKSDPLRIRSYQSFGDFKIDFTTKEFWSDQTANSNYRRELDLQTGIANVSYEIDGVKYTREVFASAPDNMIVIRLTADQPGKLTFRFAYAREQDATAFPISNNELMIQGQVADLPLEDGSAPGLNMKFGGLVRGIHKGGTLVTNANSFFVKDADEVVFYFTAATDYDFSQLNYNRSIDPIQRCKDILDRAGVSSYEQVKTKHILDHRSLFDRVVFNMGESSNLPTNERLKNIKDGKIDLSLISLYFQYGRYLLMGSSRSPGVLPANLQGIWNKDMNAAWSSDFHTNINIQMNYWPAEVTNLSETVLPFSNLISALREPGRETARKTYNSEGWTMNHLTDIYGRTAIADGVGWGTFPIAGAWLVLHQWEHFLYTNNHEYLKKEAYPAMREAAEFILGYLIEDKKGNLVTAPSNSPENKYRMANGKEYQVTYGATMDIQIINELFNACLKAGQLIGEKSEFSNKLKHVLTKLPPVKISPRYDTIQEWIEDYEEVEPGHRHISHLFGLYPGKSITADKKELFAAARKTIERRRFYNENEGNRMGSYTGWSRAWMINFYARLLDGDEAGKNVQELLAKTTLNNLFNTHPPFQIDGNFGGTAGIAEMLIQSHHQEIHLLPALPPSWATGEIKGLRARNGLVVDMKWENGVLISATIHAIATKKVTVRYNNKVKTMKVTANKPLIVQL